MVGVLAWSLGTSAWEFTRNVTIRVKAALGNGGALIVNNRFFKSILCIYYF